MYFTVRSFARATVFALACLVVLAETHDIRAADIPDLRLIDQGGSEVRVRAELSAQKVVVMNFITTSGLTIDPPMGATFGQLQKLLGSRAGGDVFLVSVSVDPTNDTPQRLKAWRDRFGDGSGWSLWTGPTEEVDKLLKWLDVFAPDIADRPAIALVFSPQGTWQRISGLASAEYMLGIVNAASTDN